MVTISEMTTTINNLDACFSECLARAGGAIKDNDPKDRDYYLDKSIGLKTQIDTIHYAMFHTNTAGFKQLSDNFERLTQLEKDAQTRIAAAVSALQTTLDIVSFVDDCLVVAAGLSKSL